MTTIIRVEHPDDGLGIWNHYGDDIFTRDMDDAGLGNLSDRHFNFNDPSEDGIGIKSNEFCAYKSIDQIQQWIRGDEFAILAAEGFQVLLLEVSHCRIGRDQAVYRKEDIISSKDITSLFIPQDQPV